MEAGSTGGGNYQKDLSPNLEKNISKCVQIKTWKVYTWWMNKIQNFRVVDKSIISKPRLLMMAQRSIILPVITLCMGCF